MEGLPEIINYYRLQPTKFWLVDDGSGKGIVSLNASKLLQLWKCGSDWDWIASDYALWVAATQASVDLILAFPLWERTWAESHLSGIIEELELLPMMMTSTQRTLRITIPLDVEFTDGGVNPEDFVRNKRIIATLDKMLDNKNAEKIALCQLGVAVFKSVGFYNESELNTMINYETKDLESRKKRY